MRWIRSIFSHWAVEAAKSARRQWEREAWEREASRQSYIRAKAREHIEIMKAVREMEQGD